MISPEDLKDLDQSAHRFLGKSIRDCSWDDLTRLQSMLLTDATSLEASAERAEVALREAEACGCLIAVPDGDIGSARVAHTCGRAA